MSDSIFKEIAFTPHIFQKNILLNDERKFERLLNLLDGIAINGHVVGVFSDWFKFINENILEFNEFEKDELIEVLKYLNDRQRIVHTPNKKCENNDEYCWIKQALYLNSIRSFELILATEQNDSVKSFDDLDRKTIKSLQNQGAKVLPQTKENMQKILAPILTYAEIAKVYDPYFDLSKPRYLDAFKILLETLGCQYEDQEFAILEVHTSVKIVLDKDKTIDWQMLDLYQKLILDFENKYGHSIKFYIWEDTKNNKWHDRWILTNQCGVTLGKGSDISEWTDATWGILDYEQIPYIEQKFITNRAEFNLISIIDNNGVKKLNKSIRYSEFRSSDEIKEKKEQKKTFCKESGMWIKV